MVETGVTEVNNNCATIQTTIGSMVGSSPYVRTGIVNCSDSFVSSRTEFNIKGGIKVIVENKVARIEFPKIEDINIIVPNKVVEVTFTDGTKEKSVCRETDTFSLESAISICISKKIMGGSGAYNNAVKRGMKVYQDKLNKKAAEKAEQERIEKKRAKRLAYKERRATKRAKEEAKRREQEKEEQIEIQKEAYLRAMDILKNEGRTVAN